MSLTLRVAVCRSCALAVALLVFPSTMSLGAQGGQPPPATQAPAAPSPAVPSTSTPGPLFNLAAVREDAVALLRRLADSAHVSLAFVGEVKGTATLDLHDASFDQAVALITRSSGLYFQKLDNSYLIGPTRFDAPGAATVAQASYRVQHVRADRLVEALKGLYTDQLRVVLGPDEYRSPKLSSQPSSSSTSAAPAAPSNPYNVGGAVSLGSPSSSTSTGAASTGAGARDIFLVGDAAIVARALEVCRQTDQPRRQVRFSVKFTNFDYNWLRQYGVTWTGSRINISEQPNEGTGSSKDRIDVFSFGTLTRNPLFIEAALKASEQDGAAALKSIPSITVLDGEHGYILIGERRLYPKLTGYTQAQTPIYDKEEVRVGINLELAVKLTDADDMVLTLFPQVSGIIGYLEAGGSSYPQIATLEQQTTVHVHDGETIVIGGLLSEKTVDAINGVPGLMKVPYLGKLFTYKNKEVHKQDLVVLITAEIVKDDRP